MRVVFLTHNFPRTPGDLSGAFLVPLAHALIRRGHDIAVIAPSDRGNVGEPVMEGIRVRRVRYAPARREILAYRGVMHQAVKSPGGLLALRGLLSALRRATREELAAGAELVHAHWWVPGGVAAPTSAPMVLTVHGTDAALLSRSALARAVGRRVLRRARVVTAVSSQAAAAIHTTTGLVVPPERVQPMPVNTEAFIRSMGGGGAVTVARLTAQKRVHLAIEAVALLRDRGRPVPLTIVGDGPERGPLEQLATERGLGSLVSFVGAVPPGAVPAFLAHADVVLFPAEREGFGLVAAEALMAGVPVVACLDGGGVLDVIDGPDAGRLVGASPVELALAVEGLLDDPGRFERAARAGESWHRRLTPDAVAERFEGWYREAAGEN